MQVNAKIAELECATNYFSKQEVQTSEILTLYEWSGVDSVKDSSKRECVLKYLKAADFNISNIGYDDKDNVTLQHKNKSDDGASVKTTISDLSIFLKSDIVSFTLLSIFFALFLTLSFFL